VECEGASPIARTEQEPASAHLSRKADKPEQAQR
jgi:hypothetical protein